MAKPGTTREQPVVRAFDATAVRPPEGCPRPFALPDGWPPSTPVDLEIGCGAGWHPVRYARSRPDRYLIAIEHTREKFEKFLARFESHGRPANLSPVHADAVAWVTHALPPRSISRIFLLYPNPNPKNPAKRWMRMPFMRRLLECLAPGGEINLATNEAGYAAEAKLYAERCWDLELRRESRLVPAAHPAHRPRTHFEKKYLERGQTCFDLVFARAGS